MHESLVNACAFFTEIGLTLEGRMMQKLKDVL